MSLFHTAANPADTSTAEIPVRNADGSPASYTPDELKAFARGDFVINGNPVPKDDPRFLCHLVAQIDEALDVQITTTSGTEFWVINGVAQAVGADLATNVVAGDVVSLFAPGGSSDVVSIDAWDHSQIQGDITNILNGGNITSVTVGGGNKQLYADVNPLFLKSPLVTYACNGVAKFTFNSDAIRYGECAGTLVTLEAVQNDLDVNMRHLDAVSTLTSVNFSFSSGVTLVGPMTPTYSADIKLRDTRITKNVYAMVQLLDTLVASGMTGKTFELDGGAMPAAAVATQKAALEAAGNTVSMYVF